MRLVQYHDIPLRKIFECIINKTNVILLQSKEYFEINNNFYPNN